MPVVREMYSTHPQPRVLSRELMDCLESCIECESVCMMCADACLSEADVDMLRHCIRTDLDCANICEASRKVLQRQTESDIRMVRAQVESMATACRCCAEECERHATHHEHCRMCAEVCRQCERACQSLLRSSVLAAA